ncbi:complement C1q-like protein 4 [Melanotaenia boesemani]|uniref:complement C1q-like protein 4 n=1 Tax=Melanotaenia boesemani TaxID=1250792 RepID=UPI001C03F934|nr:complement C1q-like protein 4 [Melanotaenia boesemani]
MSVVVLLCLLHAASADFYSWDGPSRVAPDPVLNIGSACSTDQSSCGCCFMLQETNKLKTYFDATLTELEKEYVKTNKSLHTVEVSRVAFTVSLYSGDNFRCFGPFSDNKIIIYKHAFINYGGAYNTDTGIFTVPYSGVYSLAITVYSDSGSPGSPLALCGTLYVNDKAVAGAKDLNKYDREDSATIVVALQLTAGDKVFISLSKGCFICDDSSHYNTFSAFLLYVTE